MCVCVCACVVCLVFYYPRVNRCIKLKFCFEYNIRLLLPVCLLAMSNKIIIIETERSCGLIMCCVCPIEMFNGMIRMI